jgi:hypothetical protein
MDKKPIKNFIDTIPSPEPIKPVGKVHGKNYMWHIWSMRIGAGDTVFSSDISGIWLGAKAFADAPFSVDMEGNLVATSVSITGGTIEGVDITDYVPYTGATTDLDMGDHNISTTLLILPDSGAIIFDEMMAMASPSDKQLAISGSNEIYAILDTSLLTVDRTFTFPDASGIFCLEELALAYATVL